MPQLRIFFGDNQTVSVTWPPKSGGVKNEVQLVEGAERIKRSRFSEEQIIGILRESESGTVKAVCAKHNISEPTFYAWKRKYGGLEVSEAWRLRALEEDCGRLKRLVAD